MTIKEMSKVYKKVNKLINDYELAKQECKMIECYMFEYSMEAMNDYQERAKRLDKAIRGLVKMATVTLNLASLYNEPVKALADNACNEDYFVKWCVTHDVDYNEGNNDEDEGE